MVSESVRDIVRDKYGKIALSVLNQQEGSCCGSSIACTDPVTKNLYNETEVGGIPETALLASLGCGNPTALADLKPGEIVLDLGSGGGMDVLLSAKRVGPTGFAYGLDMTEEMLALSERNKAEAGVENVRFLRGHIEDIPLPNDSIDVIISNCVINLSTDKDQVFREAYRVLKPGGRFAVSDIVIEGELPAVIRKDMEAYVGCIAGALKKEEYLRRLVHAGFVSVTIEPTRRYSFSILGESALHSEAFDALAPEERALLDGRVMAAFIRAIKPKD